MSYRQTSRRTGFTLVELLVVIAIIGILVGMLLPAVQQVREAARNANCQSNLRNVALAALNFEAVKQRYPAGSKFLSGDSNQSIGSSILFSILPQLEQQAEFDQLSDRVVTGNDGDPAETATRFSNNANELPIFFCPSSTQSDRLANDDNFTGTAAHYIGVGGPGEDIGAMPSNANDYFTAPEVSMDENLRTKIGLEGMFSPFTTLTQAQAADDTNFVSAIYTTRRSKTSGDLRDGTSNTLMFGEVSRSESEDNDNNRIRAHRTNWAIGSRDPGASSGAGYSPTNLFCVNTIVRGLNTREDIVGLVTGDNGTPRATNGQAFSSNHAGGINFAFGDGHIDTIDVEIGVNLLKRLSSIAGGETESADGF